MKVRLGYWGVVGLGLSCLAAEPLSTKAVSDRCERLQQEGKPKEAERLLLDAIEGGHGRSYKELAYLYDYLGSVYQDQNRYVLAEATYRRSISQWEALQPVPQLALARTLNNLASLYWETGKPAEAEETLLRGVAIQANLLGRYHRVTIPLLVNLATVRMFQDKWAAAEQDLEGIIRTGETEETAGAAHALGLIYRRFGRADDAVELFKRAQTIWKPRLAAGTLTPAQMADLGLSFYYTGQVQMAESIISRSLATAEEMFGTQHPNTGHVLSVYAAFLSLINKPSEARRLEKRAKLIRSGDLELRLARQTIGVADLKRAKRGKNKTSTPPI